MTAKTHFKYEELCILLDAVPQCFQLIFSLLEKNFCYHNHIFHSSSPLIYLSYVIPNYGACFCSLPFAISENNRDPTSLKSFHVKF